MTYARLQLPAILPASISKIIYLDADIVVLDDLSKLWMENVDDFALAAVSDSLDAQIKAGNLDVEGVPCVKHYFNAGVLLLNLDYWRRECISQRAFAYLDENPASPFADQDSLNVVCDGVWRRIDGRWNRQLSKDASISDFGRREVISVAHFVTWAKPWKAGVGNVNFRFYEELRNRTLFAKSRTDAIVDIGCFVIEKGKALFRFIRKNAKAKLYAQCRKPVALQSTPNK
jgi:lipopolysaccharide biosynthesis glycosyltransferase